MTDADFEASLQLNFFAALRATRAAVADMLERRAVAAAVEAEADRVAGAGRLRCGAVPAGVGALGVEARDAGSPTILAAVSAPQPGIASSAGANAATSG